MADFDHVLKRFEPGQTLFIPGASAEPRSFVSALAENAGALPPLTVIHSFVPGINTTELAADDNQLNEIVCFPCNHSLLKRNRVRLLPVSFYGMAVYLSTAMIDWVVIQLSEPDAAGYCSLGVTAEFIPALLESPTRVIGMINRSMPYVQNSPEVSMDRLTVAEQIDEPLANYDVGEGDQVSNTIASYLAELLDDGAVIQVGLGKIPGQFLAKLSSYKRLRFHSGMLSDGFARLAQAGSLDENFEHKTPVVLGSDALYSAIDDISCLSVKGVNHTHNPAVLAALEKLMAINTALEVDLWGQANLEARGTRLVSAPAGALDFSRAARYSAGGKSIIALPATAAKGTKSRIVPSLTAGVAVSIGRCDIDYVVTEFGVAQLDGRSVIERGRALIDIAAPQFRDELDQQFEKQVAAI